MTQKKRVLARGDAPTSLCSDKDGSFIRPVLDGQYPDPGPCIGFLDLLLLPSNECHVRVLGLLDLVHRSQPGFSAILHNLSFEKYFAPSADFANPVTVTKRLSLSNTSPQTSPLCPLRLVDQAGFFVSSFSLRVVDTLERDTVIEADQKKN